MNKYTQNKETFQQQNREAAKNIKKNTNAISHGDSSGVNNNVLGIIPVSSKLQLNAQLVHMATTKVPAMSLLTGEIYDQWDCTIYIGADVHSQTYSLCAFNSSSLDHFMERKVPAEPEQIISYCAEIEKKMQGVRLKFIVGYEAGCLGYSLAMYLQEHGINCVIIAPTSIKTSAQDRVSKTDRSDAHSLSDTLFSGNYKPVWIPDEQDAAVKEYVRLYEDMKDDQKKLKQRINALALHRGYAYPSNKSKWTKAHVKWLRDLKFKGMTKEAMDEYLLEYDHREEQLERYEQRIQEIAKTERYRELCQNLTALKGIKLHSALIFACEIGDFNRFASPETLSSYIGLIPTERSSGMKNCKGGITKQGNSHVRRILIECAQGTVRGVPGRKSKDLRSRQKGIDSHIVAYADKGSDRINKKFHHMMEAGKHRNVAVTACARELLNFIWGIATDNIYGRQA